jgi:hypothetical protein
MGIKKIVLGLSAVGAFIAATLILSSRVGMQQEPVCTTNEETGVTTCTVPYDYQPPMVGIEDDVEYPETQPVDEEEQEEEQEEQAYYVDDMSM